MSRGGRGGFGGAPGVSKLGGQPLPFEVDADLEIRYDELAGDSELFPEFKVPFPEPPTEQEKTNIAWYRKIRDARRAGPFYADFDMVAGSKRSAAEFDPFEGAETYAKTQVKRARGLPDLSKFRFEKELFPQELWSTIDPHGTADDENAPKRKLALSTKTLKDKLAKFDEDAELANGNTDDDDDEKTVNDDDDDGGPEEPQDDDFEEDEDDNDDYNAEQYFENGEDDYEDAGGEEGGGEDGY